MRIAVLTMSVLFIATFYSNAQTLPVSSVSDTSKIENKSVSKEESRSGKKKNVSNKAYVVRSQSYLNNVAKLEEGYTPFEGGTYAIKDYLVKGSINLVCLTYGVALGSGNMNSGESSKRYYIQKSGDDNSYREVFLTKKSGAVPAMSKILVGSGQTYRGMLNTKKSTGSMVEVSKATLDEMMGDDTEVSEKIAKIEKITVSTLKGVVKQYNAKHIE